MIIESCPPGPIYKIKFSTKLFKLFCITGSDDEDAQDEENKDVVDLIVSGSNDETGLGDEETDPNRDIHISDDRQ